MSAENNFQVHSPLTSHSLTASKASIPLPKIILIGALVLVVALVALNFSSQPVPVTNTQAPASTLVTQSSIGEVPVPDTFDDPSVNLQVLKNTLSKEKFLKKMFTIDRESYNLYEKAAKYMGVSLEEVTQFFFNCCDLTGEADIFSELPTIPAEFASVAYDVSQGKLYQIGLLDETYYKQPEFYSFIDLETGIVNRVYSLRPWSQPQLNQWGDNGMQTYPAEQFDTLSLTGRQSFSSVVFVTNAWNIQNWVGVHLVPNSDTLNYFDITISEDQTGNPYFLLGPTFPRFSRDWATKVVIEGKLKSGTPQGRYVIGINPVAPATQLSEKWSEAHPGLYAPYGFLRPADNFINLTIDVTQ